MPKIIVGNDAVRAGYRNPRAKTHKIKYVDIPGQHSTVVTIPDSMSLGEGFSTAIKALEHHFQPGSGPKWIEGDDLDLVTMLKSYYGVSKSRPKNWGSRNKNMEEEGK